MTVKLEDFRKEKIGLVGVPSRKNRIVPAIYHSECQIAFELTMMCLQTLENPNGEILSRSPYDRLTVVKWFATLEDFVSTILFVACEKKDLSYESYKKKDLGDKINCILKLSDVDIKKFKKETRIQQKINEFSSVRNELVHRNHTENDLKIRHTLFHPIPFFLNQIDVMQSLVICLEFFNIFSNIFEGSSIMPQITIPVYRSMGHIAIDELYESFIKPYFFECLKKHNLETDLSLDVKNINTLSDRLPKIEMVIQCVSNSTPIESTTITDIANLNWQQFINKKFGGTINDKYFTLANYTRQNKGQPV